MNNNYVWRSTEDEEAVKEYIARVVDGKIAYEAAARRAALMSCPYDSEMLQLTPGEVPVNAGAHYLARAWSGDAAIAKSKSRDSLVTNVYDQEMLQHWGSCDQPCQALREYAASCGTRAEDLDACGARWRSLSKVNDARTFESPVSLLVCDFGSSAVRMGLADGAAVSLRLDSLPSVGLGPPWAAVEKAWRDLYFNELRMEPQDHDLLVSEPPLTPRSQRERIAQFLFEELAVKSLTFVLSPVLAAHSQWGFRGDGVFVSLAPPSICVMPICCGYLVLNAACRSTEAGPEFGSAQLARLLPEAVVKSIESCERDLRRSLYLNIFLPSECEPSDFWRNEIAKSSRTKFIRNKIKVSAQPLRADAVWQGGSRFAGRLQGSLQSLLVPRQAYLDMGPCALHGSCL